MKIICDVCNNDEASIFCPADDAALCSACDHRVHRANNLAGKHPRFPLLLPSPKDSPLCDICQDEKALLFCQQDRAILCKNCDVNIHKVNEHKMNHCRFLLTGIKLSPVDLLSKFGDEEPISVKKPVAVVTAPVLNQTQKITTGGAPKLNGSGHGCMGGRSISEYLIETLPGWHVEDLLDSPPTYSKVDEDDPAVFWDNEVLKGSMNDCFLPDTMGIWVPQAPPPATPPPPQPLLLNSYQVQSFSNMGFGSQMMSGSSPFFDPSDLSNKMTKSNGKNGFEDGDYFTVPQINSPVTMNFKRSRTIR